jgi:hypothetical protein
MANPSNMYAFLSIDEQPEEPSRDPRTHKEALSCSEREKWIAAIKEKLDSLRKHNTYHLAKLPLGQRAVGSKWVFKTKRDVTESITRYKARLVAQGYTQRKRLDFQETFTSITQMTSQRIVIATAAAKDLELFQIDVKNAYLNREIDTDIYMKQPVGFEDPRYPDMVWALQKGLYGLKQAGNIWNAAIYGYILELGFKCTSADLCVYTISFKGENRMIITIYVDDFLVAT